MLTYQTPSHLYFCTVQLSFLSCPIFQSFHCVHFSRRVFCYFFCTFQSYHCIQFEQCFLILSVHFCHQVDFIRVFCYSVSFCHFIEYISVGCSVILCVLFCHLILYISVECGLSVPEYADCTYMYLEVANITDPSHIEGEWYTRLAAYILYRTQLKM